MSSPAGAPRSPSLAGVPLPKPERFLARLTKIVQKRARSFDEKIPQGWKTVSTRVCEIV